ncbi:MAG: 5'/3'-nucleotidase SurE [Bradymonadia bacterium]
MSERLVALVTNDDGVDSEFLRVLVEALQGVYTVWVAAPANEQSWIGRAVSRGRPVSTREVEGLGDRAWAIDGTPADCVNIALGHLVPRQPDVVVSGINLGFNATVQLILSSGTVAGAVEGALWGIPSVAFSLQLPPHRFEEIKRANGRVEGEVKHALQAAAAHAARITGEVIDEGVGIGLRPMPVVHNVNFPPGVSHEAPMEDTVPALVQLRSIFAQDSAGHYRFSFPAERHTVSNPDHSDLACLARGHVSRTRLDLMAMGMQPR